LLTAAGVAARSGPCAQEPPQVADEPSSDIWIPQLPITTRSPCVDTILIAFFEPGSFAKYWK
ncbi:MAG: hypothetical protein RL148_3134, partial [Planctomycetota bacterium]